jgi:signal transduction histidine kinase
MAEQRRRASAPERLDDAGQIVDAWIEGLPAGDPRPGGLLQAYRRLAWVVLRYGLDTDGRNGDDFLDELELHRALDGVAAHARRSGVSMSHLLGDLGRLTPATVSWLDEAGGDIPDDRDPVKVVTRVVRALDMVGRRLVHLLEESDARARRERLEALAAMTDMLSHELKNQLGAARTASQMLLNPHTTLGEDGVRRAAELVLASVEAGLRTVADVRALTASRTHQDERPPSLMPLPNLIGTIAERLQTEAATVGVDLEVHSGVDCRVDASRLRLIVFNLVWNGIKYRDESKGRPYVRATTQRRPDGRIEVRVIDNGVGIAPDEIEHVFQYRMRGRHADRVAGSGLGLAIVKEAVEQLEGEIEVTSEPGVGTTFTLVFEAHEPERGGP